MMLRLAFLLVIYISAQNQIHGQFRIGPHLQFAHYSHSQIGGPSIGLTTDVSLNSLMSIQIRGGIGYATGHRGFNKDPEATYSLLDGSAVDEYPFSQPHPGYDEEWYWFTSKLNTAETNEYYLQSLFNYHIVRSSKVSVGLQSGLNASWIFDSYIPFTFLGDFSSVFATVDDLTLVTPYFDHYFTLGVVVSMHTTWNISQNLSLGLQGGSTFLLQTGNKYAGGLQFLVRLGS